MKTFHFAIFALAVAALALTSCKKDDTGPTKVAGITLSQITAEVAPGGTLQLSVTEVLPANAADKSYTWSSTPASVATVDADGLVTVAADAADGATATITATANDGSGMKADCAITVKVVLAPGNEDLFINMTGGGTLVSGTGVTASYIGAFWRANQTGERVIRIKVGIDVVNLGAWSAEVAWYGAEWDPANGDGVILAAGPSTDAAIYTGNPGDAENYKVSGTASKVDGTVASGGVIEFRIGLTKTFAAYNESTAPARYAVVVLTYGGETPKKQKLFLRQGEGADYVMRPGEGDSGGIGVDDNRSYARKFSPYNLTDPNGNASTDFNAMTSASTGLLGVNGGAFVDYPTKAGYFFQWNYSRRAFHPTAPAAGTFANWNGSDNGTELWNAATDETCPAGYRRPQDGANTAHNVNGWVGGSEVRQSLWVYPRGGVTSPYSDNYITGYYADGYFDRRAIEDALGADAMARSAVSPSTKDAAYIGGLFFNPIRTSAGYNASLFFPLTGRRNNSDGTFGNAGRYGSYWSSSSHSASYAWYYSSTSLSNTLRTSASPVRCVRN